MKTIGLIGGMSWESSALYYRMINEQVKVRLGGLHSAKCILYSVDFAEIEAMQRNGEWDKAGHLLSHAAQSLERAGAACIVICTNTMHKVADDIQLAIQVPLLHIADITADTITNRGIQSVGLLGTSYTMEQDFYKARLAARGIQVLTPEKDNREIVNRVIFEELCKGIVAEKSIHEYKRIIEKLIDSGAEGIILGCTEIGMLIRQEDVSVPVFDTTMIHAQGAVDFALACNKL